jgi:hypothetical protein
MFLERHAIVRFRDVRCYYRKRLVVVVVIVSGTSYRSASRDRCPPKTFNPMSLTQERKTYTFGPRGCITSISPVANSACSLSYKNRLPPRPPTKNIAFGFLCLLFIILFLCLQASSKMSLITGSNILVMSSLLSLSMWLLLSTIPRAYLREESHGVPIQLLCAFALLEHLLVGFVDLPRHKMRYWCRYL